ncbi:hypothetical protein [Halosolutus gelatinilyticus]|uniref:hypothetical protein n=1 Tax=Halosolutus gelatinilyticus TaxID=2931975 RepID=UPI001FF2D076|nr:hypothetical protein [Halosolutus gelatinilyticus]
MECAFCSAPVQFNQEKVAHQICDLSEPETKRWLCRDCAEIRDEGYKTEGLTDARGGRVDCDEEADYGVAIVKKTPRGDVETDGTVFDVLCESHFEERAG